MFDAVKRETRDIWKFSRSSGHVADSRRVFRSRPRTECVQPTIIDARIEN